MEQTKDSWRGLKDLVSKDNRIVLLGFFIALVGVIKQNVISLLLAIFLALVSIDVRLGKD